MSHTQVLQTIQSILTNLTNSSNKDTKQKHVNDERDDTPEVETNTEPIEPEQSTSGKQCQEKKVSSSKKFVCKVCGRGFDKPCFLKYHQGK